MTRRSSLDVKLDYYKPRDLLRAKCLELARYNFRFCGYIKKKNSRSFNFRQSSYYVRLTDFGRKIQFEIFEFNTAKLLFKGTVGKGFEYMKKIGLKEKVKKPKKSIAKVPAKKKPLTEEEKKTKSALKGVQQEILWYQPKPSIKNAMLKLGQMGFEFSGHGCGGSEDFSLCNDKYYVSISDWGNKVETMLSTNGDDIETLFEGTIGQLFKFMKKKLSYAVP